MHPWALYACFFGMVTNGIPINDDSMRNTTLTRATKHVLVLCTTLRQVPIQSFANVCTKADSPTVQLSVSISICAVCQLKCDSQFHRLPYVSFFAQLS